MARGRGWTGLAGSSMPNKASRCAAVSTGLAFSDVGGISEILRIDFTDVSKKSPTMFECGENCNLRTIHRGGYFFDVLVCAIARTSLGIQLDASTLPNSPDSLLPAFNASQITMADDLNLVSDSFPNLLSLLHLVNEFFTLHSMKIQGAKTVILTSQQLSEAQFPLPLNLAPVPPLSLAFVVVLTPSSF